MRDNLGVLGLVWLLKNAEINLMISGDSGENLVEVG